MENPEEVLQALDEFQKMRPSEIPRELEDYLSFVAKTGDPVYQWSLIKPLFREKLVRVMTDFYENCPTLDLAPSPNIEQFNYDSMKGNLLDLLESFANAPFTVQRICELLTSPRKEYNRVDKFMRAIEKNILVVSTREPGQAARRSENGDSMINGSIDDESNNQQHEVEMESWVKDCTADTNVSLTSEQDVPLVEGVSSKLSKDDELSVISEKPEINNFIASHELSAPAMTVQSHDTVLCSGNVQNLGTNIGEVTGIAGDVPEAIMNEDTSSQPSLDSESDESETNTRKLQTTFQSRDFVKDGKVKFYQDEKTEDTNLQNELESVDKLDNDTKADRVSKSNYIEHHHPDLSIDEPILEKRQRLDDESNSLEETSNSESNSAAETKEETDAPESQGKSEESVVESVAVEAEQPVSEEADSLQEIPDFEVITKSSNEAVKEIDSKETEEEVPTSDSTKPIVEEPEESVNDSKQEEASVVIQEAMEDDAKSISTMVPDPIPIVEEPKDDNLSTVKISADEIVDVKSPTATEVSERSEEAINIEQLCEPVVQESIPMNENNEVTSNETVDRVEPAESMEVDSEESTSVFHQDEPMEEESGDQLKS